MTSVEEFTDISELTDAEHSTPEVLTYEEMFEKYHDELLRHAKRYDRVIDHEGLVQDVLFKAYEHFDKYKEMGRSRGAWLHRILKNAAIDEIRSQERRPKAAGGSDKMPEYERLADPNTDDDFTELEFSEAMKEVKRALSPKWFSIFVLRNFYHFSYEEISERTDTPLGTVRSALNRAPLALKKDHKVLEALGIKVDQTVS